MRERSATTGSEANTPREALGVRTQGRTHQEDLAARDRTERNHIIMGPFR